MLRSFAAYCTAPRLPSRICRYGSAKDTGLFAKNGLNIEPVQIRGGAVSTMAIMSGQAVLSGVGAELGGRRPASRAADIVLLACPADLEPVYLIARPEIKVARPISRAKPAAITRLNSSIHFYLRSAARMVGIDSDKEMTLLQLGGSAGDRHRAGKRQSRCRGIDHTRRPAIHAAQLAGARRFDQDRSGLSVIVRDQQPRLCQSRT